MTLLSLIAVVSLASFAFSQNTVSIQVGLGGSFYEPPTVLAQLNDTVQFIFFGGANSVTQSSSEDPCVPLAGGFSSGVAGIGLNSTTPVQIWNLVITNDSTPIWFFCDLVQPRSHCAAGMVGVINPPSISAYQSFFTAAQQVTGTPAPSISSVALTGQGAFATAPPLPVSTLLPPTLTDAPAPAQTSSLPDSATSIHHSNHKGVIIGGTVAAVVVLVISILLALLLYRAKRNSSRPSELATPATLKPGRVPVFFPSSDPGKSQSSISPRQTLSRVSHTHRGPSAYDVNVLAERVAAILGQPRAGNVTPTSPPRATLRPAPIAPPQRPHRQLPVPGPPRI